MRLCFLEGPGPSELSELRREVLEHSMTLVSALTILKGWSNRPMMIGWSGPMNMPLLCWCPRSIMRLYLLMASSSEMMRRAVLLRGALTRFGPLARIASRARKTSDARHSKCRADMHDTMLASSDVGGVLPRTQSTLSCISRSQHHSGWPPSHVIRMHAPETHSHVTKIFVWCCERHIHICICMCIFHMLYRCLRNIYMSIYYNLLDVCSTVPTYHQTYCN